MQELWGIPGISQGGSEGVWVPRGGSYNISPGPPALCPAGDGECVAATGDARAAPGGPARESPPLPRLCPLALPPRYPPGPLRDPRNPPGAAADPCLPPGPALTSPAVRHEGLLGAKQGPPSPAGHGLVLLGGVGVALGLVAVVWVLWRRPCAQVGTLGALTGTGDTGEDDVPGDTAGGEGTRGTGGGVCTGDTVDAGCRGDIGSTGGCPGVTGRRTDNTGSSRERWEVIPLSPPQPSQGPPTWEQDGT